MKIFKTIAIIGLSAGIMSCTSSKKAQLPVSLIGEWNILVAGNKAVSHYTKENNPYIVFSPDNRISGSTGCNRLMGTYKADTVDASLEFSQVACTRMACDNMTTEQDILAALEKVREYQIEGQSDKIVEPCNLNLLDADGKFLLLIERRIASELDELDGEWMLQSLNGEALKKNTGEPLYFDFNIAEMCMSGDLGDNIMTGLLVHREKERFSINFSQTGVTMMAGPNLALEDKIKDALMEVTSFKLLSDSQMALLDRKGHQVVVLNRK